MVNLLASRSAPLARFGFSCETAQFISAHISTQAAAKFRHD
jgi:hypothetical protein